MSDDEDDFFDDEDAAFAALAGESATVDDPAESSEVEKEPASKDGGDGNASEFEPRKLPDRNSPEKKKLAKELWERLAKSRPGPDNKDLLFLARFVPALSSSAAKTLLGKNLRLDELKELIQYVPKAKDAAIKAALKLGSEQLSEEDVRFIFTQSKSTDVGKYLLKKYPNDANLGLVERTTDDLKDLVEEIRSRESTASILREIDRKL